MGESEVELFTVRMRHATRAIHNTSDALVNAKLGITMSDDSVWAEGLLVFYEVFKFLEAALECHADSLLGELLLPGMARTAALEADLAHYLGPRWQEGYVLRPEVQLYITHLQKLQDENPYMLIPYIYHLYMGLFSGGQVLRAKVSHYCSLHPSQRSSPCLLNFFDLSCQRFLSLSSMAGGGQDDTERPGNSVTSYGENTISGLKKQLRKAVNDVAEHLDDETKDVSNLIV